MMNGSDEISIDEEYAHSQRERLQTTSGLKHLPHWPSVNIEFEDIVYSVPDVPTEGEFSSYLYSPLSSYGQKARILIQD
jgi:hypothetical protein